jgi:hypothetical protein
LHQGDPPPHAPLAHFFLLTLVFLAFASHPLPEGQKTAFLPWLMRVVFVGGSAVALGFAAYNNLDQVSARLTPSVDEMGQWPVLLGCLAGGFGLSLLARFIMGRKSETFQTGRAWLGILAILLLVFETLFQFVILPDMSDKPALNTMKIWAGFLVATVSAYFGCRA